MAVPAAAARPPRDARSPAIVSVRADPPALGYLGGRTLVAGRASASVTTCQLKLVSHQSFPVVYNGKAKRCHLKFHSYVTVGVNPSRIYRSVAFELIGRNAAGQFSRGMLFVQVAPNGSTYLAPPAPALRTALHTARTAAKAHPAQSKRHAAPGSPSPAHITFSRRTSENWSGYLLLGNRFTSVSGTFTVPQLGTDETCQTSESQWVGIDGMSASGDLIQAGVNETPYNYKVSGKCTVPTEFFIYAWWEIFPSGQTLIPGIRAKVGDQITVRIWKSLIPGYWDITVTDKTNGHVFGTGQRYGGPAHSAEWVDESANSLSHCAGGVDGFVGLCTETAYFPAVTFSGLAYNRTANVTTEMALTMEQQSVDVSTPSIAPNLAQLLHNGFTTTYTGGSGT